MIDLPVFGDESSSSGKETRHWRSTAQLAQASGFEASHSDEFMPEATAEPSHANRRQFMQLMGASMAFAGLTACRRPFEKIMPYSRKPEDVIEGIPQFFATAMPHRGHVRALLVESHQGRPTKVEGNPDHPISRGATGIFEQASILNLYDPDRSRRIRRDGQNANWGDFVAAVAAVQGPLLIVQAPHSSPTQERLLAQIVANRPGSRLISYRAEGDDASAMGAQLATGRPLRAVYDFSQARVIVGFEADFLGVTDANDVHNTRTFAQSRRPETGEMSRFYAVESAYTITGAAADHRLRMRSSRIPAFAAAVARALGVSVEAPSIQLSAREQQHVDAIVADVRAAGSQAVFVAGASQPAEVHALAFALNQATGSIGSLVRMLDTGASAQTPQAQALAEAVQALRARQFTGVMVIGANPVYDAPASLNLAEALRSAPVSIHVGSHYDETAQVCAWHVPLAHYLEAWGDGRAFDGTLSVIQPLVAPLNDVDVSGETRTTRNDIRSEVEILNLIANGTDVSGYDIVRETWRARLTGSFESAWQKVLHDGLLADSGYPAVTASIAPVAISAPAAASADLEVQFVLDSRHLDGSFGNNAWMLELPDAMTKLTWDNVALVSRATAERLSLNVRYSKGKFLADRIELDVDGQKATLPVWIAPGHADDQITVALGYGRAIQTQRELKPQPGFFARFDTEYKTDVYFNGPIGNGVGTNVGPLRTASFSSMAAVQVAKVDSGYMLASTQEHGSMVDRPLVLEATLDQYKENPNFPTKLQPKVIGDKELGGWEAQEPLWGPDGHPRVQDFARNNDYYRNQWGMVVDLSTCTGCNACVIACQSENNIQIVGKEQISLGRELHWLRLDRYYIGEDEADPRVAFQYVTCMHCENAPCESVCPVAATVHSPDGLNEMVYNRCIGTRYCSNNCPYKVRRYNWYNWTVTLPVSVQMQQNPNVTVRSRGVMEKCTYCVQRIREVNGKVNVEQRNIRDGEVQTACQAACAAGAITFGDLNDPNSAVSQKKRDSRRYELIAELGTRPRTSYLGRVRNPNTTLEPTTPLGGLPA